MRVRGAANDRDWTDTRLKDSHHPGKGMLVLWIVFEQEWLPAGVSSNRRTGQNVGRPVTTLGRDPTTYLPPTINCPQGWRRDGHNSIYSEHSR